MMLPQTVNYWHIITSNANMPRLVLSNIKFLSKFSIKSYGHLKFMILIITKWSCHKP